MPHADSVQANELIIHESERNVSMLIINQAEFRRSPYKSENDLEQSILQVQKQLFGENRFYIDVKRKIGLKGGVRNIPDGYLIDLFGPKPRLYVVENELAVHDPLRHIAVQILEFSLSFESEPLAVKRILLDALNENGPAKAACEEYARLHSFRGLDHLLEHLVFDSPFSALVIIDEMPDNLQNVLSQKFKFGVEVLELVRYVADSGECGYLFEPFLADVTADVGVVQSATSPSTATIDASDVDTVVVPAREDGFQEVFLGEQRWWAVRIHGSMRPQIKYIAAYRVAPESAITHVAPVKSIEPWKDTDKVVLNFAEPARQIGPIQLVRGGEVKPSRHYRR